MPYIILKKGQKTSLTNYRSLGKTTLMLSKKNSIITTALLLAEQKGLSNVSLSDIASAVGIQKASLYSHFSSRQDLEDCLIQYCQDTLKAKNFTVDFKAPNAQTLLVSLVNSFLSTFTDQPLSSYFSILQQQRMTSAKFADLYEQLNLMITARVRVALEYCVQRSWLDIPDTDVASDFFTCAIINCLCRTINSYRQNTRQDIDWELDRLVDGLLTLFSPR